MSKPIAIIPGSFDPVTLGHVSVVKRALPMFEKVIVAMGVNSTKRYMFSNVQRLSMLEECMKPLGNVEVMSFEGLTVDLCEKQNAQFILRGLRNGSDHDHERTIAMMNLQLKGIETVFLLAEPEHAHVSSTVVRELITNNGDVSSFVPKEVLAQLRSKVT